MTNKLAWASIVQDLTDGGPPAIRMHARITSTQAIEYAIPVAVARQLRDALSASLREYDAKYAPEVLSVAERIAIAREKALRRDDFHVNPRRVVCAHDHCGTTVVWARDTHPWDLAREQGWKLIWEDGSDLLCDDCAGPKEECKWKKEDTSRYF